MDVCCYHDLKADRFPALGRAQLPQHDSLLARGVHYPPVQKANKPPSNTLFSGFLQFVELLNFLCV